jgi:hypothetical protein
MAKRTRIKGGSGGYRSKAQWRWAFATHKKFARRMAHRTRVPYRALPLRKSIRRKAR